MLCRTLAIGEIGVLEKYSNIGFRIWLESSMLAGLAAALPDVLGVYNYRAYERHGKKADGLVRLLHIKFHRRIQHFERPWGIIVEILVFGALLLLLIRIV
jgi:hypothetical protein